MTKDILQYYNLISHNYNKGLFEKHVADRTWSNEVKKSKNGVSYTQFIDAKDMMITNDLSLLDMFHGLCHTYMAYFITMNPDWKPMQMRRLNFWNTLIHAYAVKTIGDITYFADARGVTDNCLDFFNDYRFAKNNMIIEPVRDLPELTYEDSRVLKKAYDIIYHNKSIRI